MMSVKGFYGIMLLLVFVINLSAQTSNVESLQDFESLKGEKKLDALIKMSKETVKTDIEKSIWYARQALVLANDLKLEEKIPHCYLQLSDGYLHSKSPDSALIFAQKALDGYQNSGSKSDVLNAMNLTGLAHLRAGNPEKAASTFTETITLCDKFLTDDPDNKQLTGISAEVFNNLMMAFVKQGNYDEAKRRLLQFRRKSDFGESFTEMLIEGNLSVIYRMTGQYDSSLIMAANALQIALKLDEPLNVVKITIDMADIYQSMGKYSESLANYQKALKLMEPLNDRQKLATLYNNLASLYKKISMYDKATAFYIEALKIKESLNDSAGMAVLYNNIGLVYNDWGEYFKAREYLFKAVSTNVRKKLQKNLATNYNNLGKTYSELKMADSALFFYKKSLELKNEIGLKAGMVVSQLGLGRVYLDLLNDEKAAYGCYTKALELANETGSENDIAESDISLGELLFRKQEYTAAKKHFDEALTFAIRENAPELIAKCSQFLTEINILTGNEKSSLDNFRLFKSYSDSVYNKNKLQSVIEMKTRYETEKQEKENIQLAKQTEIQRLRIRLLVISLIVLTIATLIILFFYYQKNIVYKKIVKKNLEIVKAEKQIEICRQQHVENDSNSAGGKLKYEEIENSKLGLLVKFLRYMDDEKPYLDSNLSMDDVCRNISTNRTYLSQMINEHFRKNFNAYVNELRIKEARRLLSEKEHSHISVEGIGSMAGFSSKVSFHSNFKNLIGVTPSFYRKTLEISTAD